MTSQRLVPASVREALLGVPSDIASLERNSLLADDDLDLIGTRRPSSPDGTHLGASAAPSRCTKQTRRATPLSLNVNDLWFEHQS